MTLDRDPKHLQPAMAEKVRLLLNDCLAEKIPVWLNEGYRPKERQEALYAQGRTTPGPIVTKARWYQSYHVWGLAVDLYPCDHDGDPLWGIPDSHEWRRVVQLAKMRGLAWGGDWTGDFKDRPHFELRDRPPLLLLRLRYPRGWRP